MTLLLRHDDIQGLLSMGEAIDAVETGFREWGSNPAYNAPRRRIHTPSGARVSVHQGAVPALGGTGATIHCELVDPSGKTQRYTNKGDFVYLLYDADTSELMAVIMGYTSAKEISSENSTAVRTSSTSIVGTKYLAREDASTVGIFGSRREAKNHLVGLCHVRNINKAKVYSPTQVHREAFAKQTSHLLDIEVVAVNEPQKVVKGVDIIICATNTNEPVFDGNWLEPGVHVTSIIGSNIGLVKGGFISKPRREIDNTTIARSDVIAVTSKEQAIQDQQGDLFQPMQEGILNWDNVIELGELVAGKVRRRTNADQITLFKNNAGQGVADVAIGCMLYKRAKEKGIGMEIPGWRYTYDM